MFNERLLSNLENTPYLLIKDGSVANVSQQFIDMTGFACDELQSSSITEIFNLLRIGPSFNIENIEVSEDYFLFTKTLDVKFVNIKVIHDDKEIAYIFLGKDCSIIDVRSPFIQTLYTDNHYGIGIFSLPDLTLIQANEKYISSKDKPFNKKENCIGKHISEFCTDFKGSNYEEVWNEVINSGKACYLDEFMIETNSKHNTYWKLSLVPIFDAGLPKYCILMTTEITEQVLHRKKIEEQTRIIKQQNEKLKWQADLLNLSSEAILAWELDGGIVYWNSGAQKLYGYSSEEAKCYTSHDLLKTVLPNDFIDFIDFKDTLKRAGAWKGTIEHTGKNGERMIIATNIQVIVDETGREIVLETNRDVTEKRRLRDNLKHQKEELEEIIASIDDAIFIYDSDKNYYLLNNAAKKHFGTKQLNKFGDAINTYKYYDLNGIELSVEKMTISKVFNGEVVINDRVTLKNNDSTIHISINGRPIYDDNGNIKFAVLCTRDVTQDVENQKMMEQQNKKLEAIIQNVSDGMFLYNIDKNLTFLNDESKNFIHYASDYKKVDPCCNIEYFDRSGNPLLLKDLPPIKAINGERIRNFFLTAKCGEKAHHYNISASPIYTSGKIDSVLLCTSDITELVDNEKKLMEKKEQLQAILDNMQEAMLVFDKNGKYIIINKVAKKLFPAVIEELGSSYKNVKYYTLSGCEIPFESTPTFRVKCGEFVNDYFLHVKKDDWDQYVSISGTPVFDTEGNFLYGIICCRNVTDSVKSEQALKQAQLQLLQAEREKIETLETALAMKDEFLSLISHEFRTPLNVISTALQAMDYICGSELSYKAKKYLGMIRQNTFRQLRLVNNLLDITRANAGRIKVNKKNIDIVFLTKSITESVQSYALQKKVAISFVSPLINKIIGIDDEKYERILLNLLSNAIKFTPEGKSIAVILLPQDNNIRVEVSDTGIGIPHDKAEVIFERFGQVDSSLSRQAEGTGIGLSLVKNFVEALGGSISVKSKLGKGSTFTILLPDTKAVKEEIAQEMVNLLDNRLVQTTDVEFSDIYL